MNLIDVGIVVLLGFGLVAGWRSGFFPQILGLAGAAAGAVIIVLALPFLHGFLDGIDPALRAIAVLVSLLAAIGVGEAIGSSIGAAIGRLLEKDKHIVHRKKSGLIITHTGFILDYVDTNFGHMMCDGVIKCRGNPREMLKEIKERGYRECLECQKV